MPPAKSTASAIKPHSVRVGTFLIVTSWALSGRGCGLGGVVCQLPSPKPKGPCCCLSYKRHGCAILNAVSRPLDNRCIPPLYIHRWSRLSRASWRFYIGNREIPAGPRERDSQSRNSLSCPVYNLHHFFISCKGWGYQHAHQRHCQPDNREEFDRAHVNLPPFLSRENVWVFEARPLRRSGNSQQPPPLSRLALL
jgi:hypothetical protein